MLFQQLYFSCGCSVAARLCVILLFAILVKKTIRQFVVSIVLFHRAYKITWRKKSHHLHVFFSLVCFSPILSDEKISELMRWLYEFFVNGVMLIRMMGRMVTREGDNRILCKGCRTHLSDRTGGGGTSSFSILSVDKQTRGPWSGKRVLDPWLISPTAPIVDVTEEPPPIPLLQAKILASDAGVLIGSELADDENSLLEGWSSWECCCWSSFLALSCSCSCISRAFFLAITLPKNLRPTSVS